jgi:phosphoribosylamine--glycine ligase
VPIKINDATELVAFAKAEQIDLTVVGPDDALASGIVDLFQANGLRIFGPTQSAARLESSKAFAKEFMHRHNIPTARSETFSESSQAHRYCQRMHYPVGGSICFYTQKDTDVLRVLNGKYSGG